MSTWHNQIFPEGQSIDYSYGCGQVQRPRPPSERNPLDLPCSPEEVFEFDVFRKHCATSCECFPNDNNLRFLSRCILSSFEPPFSPPLCVKAGRDNERSLVTLVSLGKPSRSVPHRWTQFLFLFVAKMLRSKGTIAFVSLICENKEC
ncbi:hypothetical protein OUZ56_015694 [Daphnia magna]|uniref:Uncharacterized protein n=1 Tax=Daphnia magna TaxID=35525 RepID=A0ABR0ANG6_9CRUS|nr:hypothetical protein OUZ56_015694 [Daphnia magna]